MRIRKSASRLLGSTYLAPAAPALDAAGPLELLAPPPPPPQLASCSAPLESRGWGGFASPAAPSGEPCELSRSPWDLIAELSLVPDPQVEDELVDRYFVHVACRASWLFSATMPAASVKKKKPPVKGSTREVGMKAPKLKKAPASKEGEAMKKAKVKKEEGEEEAPQVWKCKKNDGKTWQCHRTVSSPNSLCEYHIERQRSHLNSEFASTMEEETWTAGPPAAASNKPPTSSKARKKKSSNDFNATEGFYYYTGFGPFRSKRHCRSTMHDSVPVKQEEEEPPVKEEEEEEPPEDDPSPSQAKDQATDDSNQAAALDDVCSRGDDIAGIAGVDEESSDEDFDGVGVPGCTIYGNGDSKRKTPWKRWRKPVKARSLKSLM